jgi:hypothetical protein
MKKLFGLVVTTILASSVTALPAAAATTMTFNNLPEGKSSVATYTENGITMLGAGGTIGTSGRAVIGPGFPFGQTFSLTASSGIFTPLSIDVEKLNYGTGVFVGGYNNGAETGQINALDFNSPNSFTLDLRQLGAVDNVSITAYNTQGFFDNFVIAESLSGAVPEPASWVMMLLGFGLVGFAIRRRSNVRTTVSYA